MRHRGVVAFAARSGQRDAAGLDLAEPHPQRAVGDAAVGIAEPARLGERAKRRLAQQHIGTVQRGGPWIASIIVMPRAVIRRYSSSMSSTRGVRWLMWVVVTPAMSAATADTAVSSSYQARSTGSRDSANAATAAVTKSSALVGVAAAGGRDPAGVGDQGGVEQLAPRPGIVDPAAQVRCEEPACPRWPASR